MKTYGVLGWPVGHSLSPHFQNAGLRAAGIDAVYTHFPSRPDELPAAIAGIRALGIAGVNLTLPHKVEVLPLLDAVDPLAAALGAVNTIVRVDTESGVHLAGYNTDAGGLVASLSEAGVELSGKRVVVVGAGGAARAAVGGIAAAGADEILVLARRIAQADELLATLASFVASRTATRVRVAELASAGEIAGADLLVQATSATLREESGQALADQLPLDRLAADAAVIDIVYDPRETAVLRTAREAGKRTVDGVGMLLHQGALAFSLWTGQPAPIAEMRVALEDALTARASR